MSQHQDVHHDEPFHANGVSVRPLVVVADDYAFNLTIMESHLRVLGFEVHTASNGAEAVAACCAHPPELLVTDISMPVLNGLEAAKEIRSRQDQGLLPRFPIMAWTTDNDAQTRRLCVAAGMDGFCAKPTLLDVLIGELRRLLGGNPDCRESPGRPD